MGAEIFLLTWKIKEITNFMKADALKNMGGPQPSRNGGTVTPFPRDFRPCFNDSIYSHVPTRGYYSEIQISIFRARSKYRYLNLTSCCGNTKFTNKRYSNLTSSAIFFE